MKKKGGVVASLLHFLVIDKATSIYNDSDRESQTVVLLREAERKPSPIPPGAIAYFLSHHALPPSGPGLSNPPTSAPQIRQSHLFLSHRIKATIN